MDNRRKPILIEEDDPDFAATADSDAPASPQDAPQPDLNAMELGAPPAVARAANLAAGRTSWVSRLFWGGFIGFLSIAVSITAYDFVIGLLERNMWLGRAALALGGAACLALLVAALGELAALSRFRKTDDLRRVAERALAEEDRDLAVTAVKGLVALYRGRPDLEWAAGRVAERKDEALDADALLTLAEREYLTPLDARAAEEAKSAARTVTAATALAPIALIDVLTALFVNLRMVRRVAEIYGGRAGMLGSWRLLKSVAAHLVATGAVAVSDDLIGPLVGGGALSKISRRFGEGLVNGVLTARVGAAAIEVCRPAPFIKNERPKARTLALSALKGFTDRG